MPSRQRAVMSISLPPHLAQEYRQFAKDKGETASELFREMFAFYKLKEELYEIQAYGAGNVREMGISEEEIEKDDALFEEAFALAKVKTKKELINLSLKELIRKKRLEHLAGLYSSGAVAMTREELEEYRANDK